MVLFHPDLEQEPKNLLLDGRGRIGIMKLYLITLGWSRQFFLTASGTPMLMHRFSLNRISLSKDSTR